MATKPKSRRKTAKPSPKTIRKPKPTGSAASKSRSKFFEVEVLKKANERCAAFRAQVQRRPASMNRLAFELPDDVRALVLHLAWSELEWPAPWWPALAPDDACNLIRAALLFGCREGFIEGFLYGEEKARPGAMKNRERLRRQNMDKLERLGIADRNAAIAAAFQQLEAEVPGAEDRKQLLAERCDLTARQIHNILRSAGALKRP